MHGWRWRNIWSFLLESCCLPQFVRLFFISCLRSSFANVDVSHYVLFVLFFVLATCDCMSIRNVLLTPGFHGHALHLFQQSLCLGDSVFVCIHPCRSRQGSLNNRYDAFSTFVVVWFLGVFPCDASAAQPRQPPVWPRSSMSADNTKNLLSSASGVLSTTILGNGSPALLCQLWLALSISIQEPPLVSACHASRPSSSRPMHRSESVSSNSCLALLRSWYCTKLFLFKQWFLESRGSQMNWHHLLPISRNQIFSLKLRHWLSPYSSSSSQFARVSVLCQFSFCSWPELQTGKPAE